MGCFGSECALFQTMAEENSLQASMEGDLPPRLKRGRPNDSPDPKDQLLSKDVDICGHCRKKCSPSSEALATLM